MKVPEITTPRLRLVAVTPRRLALQESRPQQLAVSLGAILPTDWPGPDWDAATYAFMRRQWKKHPHTLGWHRYVLLPGPEPVLIGALGAHPRTEAEAEVGYGILPRWTGQGYATEATIALIALLFASGNSCVSAQTYPSHTASLRVMAKCGMSFVGPGPDDGCVLYEVHRRV